MVMLSLEAARKNAGYSSRQEVAEIVGIHPQTLGKYEKDSSSIPMDLLTKLSNLYGLPKDNIFLGKKYENNSTINVNKMSV